MKNSNRDKWNNAENLPLSKGNFNFAILETWVSVGRVTQCVILLCVFTFILQITYPRIFSFLCYFPTLDFDMVIKQPWRLFTPSFMHGNWVHIGFNLILWWLLAQQIERVKGSVELLTVVIISSAITNFCQFIFSGPAFLGLSGVVFSLAGYCLAQAYFVKQYALQLSQPIMLMLMISLVIGILFGNALNIGNASHVSGLLTGFVLGFIRARM